MNLITFCDDTLTDKNTTHSYIEAYEELFSAKKETATHVLEIGIGPYMPNGGSILMWAGYFSQAKAEIAHYEEQKSQYEGKLKAAMGDASVAVIPGYGEITWKSTKPGKAFDEKAFAAAHPDLYQQFIKERPGYRRFLLKPSKELVCKT